MSSYVLYVSLSPISLPLLNPSPLSPSFCRTLSLLYLSVYYLFSTLTFLSLILVLSFSLAVVLSCSLSLSFSLVLSHSRSLILWSVCSTHSLPPSCMNTNTLGCECVRTQVGVPLSGKYDSQIPLFVPKSVSIIPLWLLSYCNKLLVVDDSRFNWRSIKCWSSSAFDVIK